MKLLLDEMWSPEIAVQLRQRGHDVVVIVERLDLRNQPDSVVFGIARDEERALVTDNASDFRTIAADEITAGRSHCGLILTSERRFSRHDPRTLGRMIKALDNLLSASWDLPNAEHWLR